MEICFVERTQVASQYPCLVFFTTVARMMRPVINLACNRTEMIGTFEQVYLNICVTPDEAINAVCCYATTFKTSKVIYSPT